MGCSVALSPQVQPSCLSVSLSFVISFKNVTNIVFFIFSHSFSRVSDIRHVGSSLRRNLVLYDYYLANTKLNLNLEFEKNPPEGINREGINREGINRDVCVIFVIVPSKII